MKRDEIRANVATYNETERRTRELTAFKSDFVLHVADYKEIQESRKGAQTPDGQFDSTKHLLALLVLTAKDEDGMPVFTREDLEMLLKSNGPEMDRLVRSVLDLNNLTDKAHEEGKEPSPATTAGGVS
jgi:hypothetical protein